MAYQAIKYRNRKGWTHADVLRKAHPKAHNQLQNDLFKWIVDGDVPSIQLVQAFEAAKTASEDDLVALIAQYDLPREALPTEALNSPKVWRSLLVHMPLMALVRNLGKLSNVGVVAPGRWVEIEHTVGMLTNRQKIRQSRIHPIQVLAALTTYSQGRGVRGSLTWDVVPEIVAALNTTYEMAFDNVEPSGKKDTGRVGCVLVNGMGRSVWCSRLDSACGGGCNGNDDHQDRTIYLAVGVFY